MSFLYLALLATFFFNNSYAGLHHGLVGPNPALVGAPCSNSVQCTGVAVCGVQQVCECPAPLYRAVGGDCQVVTYNTLSYVPSVKTTTVYALPGNPCGPQYACVGGSFCNAGLCGCPTGQIISARSCIAPGPLAAPAPAFPFNAPAFPFPAPVPAYPAPVPAFPFPAPAPAFPFPAPAPAFAFPAPAFPLPAAAPAFPAPLPAPIFRGPLAGPFPAPFPGPLAGPFPAPFPGPLAGPFPAPFPGPLAGPFPAPFPGPLAGPFPGHFAAPIAAPLPVPAPLPLAPIPAFGPALPFPGAPLAAVGCASGCFGGQVCVNNACACQPGLILRAGACAPVVIPVVQAIPGGLCSLGQECTGGSICTNGVCCCPPELVQVGESCVLPPPPPPPPVVTVHHTTVIAAIGHPCLATTQCVAGAICSLGSCQCNVGYVAAANGCLAKSR